MIKQVFKWCLNQLIGQIEQQHQPAQRGCKVFKPRRASLTSSPEWRESDSSDLTPLNPEPIDIDAQQPKDPRLEALNDTLEKLAEQAEKMNLRVILSFDIDDTMYYRSQDRATIAFEESVLANFHQWLTTGKGKNRFILIPNTARAYSNQWQSQMQTQNLPVPYAIIHSNGAKIELSNNQPAWAPLFIQNREPLLLASSRLQEVLLNHNTIAKSHYVAEYEEHNYYALESIAQLYAFGTQAAGHVFSVKGAVAACEGVQYDNLFWKFNFMQQAPGAFKSIHQQTDPRYFIYYDRSVNKGTALVFLLSELLPLLPEDGKKVLFTAGDDIFDLPMLFMDLLGQAFFLPVDRNPVNLKEDLREIGVDFYELESVQKIWHAGILPPNCSDPLFYALQRNDLLSSDRLLYAKEASLNSVLLQVLHSLSGLQPD